MDVVCPTFLDPLVFQQCFRSGPGSYVFCFPSGFRGGSFTVGIAGDLKTGRYRVSEPLSAGGSQWSLRPKIRDRLGPEARLNRISKGIDECRRHEREAVTSFGHASSPTTTMPHASTSSKADSEHSTAFGNVLN